MMLLASPFLVNAKVVLTDSVVRVDLSKSIRAYIPSEELEIQEFRQLRTRFSYTKSDDPNYGMQPYSVWLTTELVNQSRINDWVIELNFTQLDHVDAYLYENNELVYFQQGGRLDNKIYYRMPTFRVNLENDKHYKLYLRVKADHIPIITPIRILQSTEHAYLMSVDSMIWGIFYGGLFILAVYALSILAMRREMIAGFLLLHVSIVSLWQLVWSGYSQLLPHSFSTTPLFSSLDFLLPFVCAISSLFTIVFFREQIVGTVHAVILRLLCLGIMALVILMATDSLGSYTQALSIRLIGFLTIIVNLYVAVNCAKDNYKPAYPIIAGFTLLGVGSILSSLFVLGILPSVILSTYIFHVSLVILTCCFAFALNIKLRYSLELEVEQATKDANNNFLLIEEQNVHLDMARRDALKASDVKSQFLANMSHEIRTPLNAIIGFSRELESKPDKHEIEEHLRIINSSATDLLTIVNDILDFSKMEAGKLSINCKPFSPYDMFEDVAVLVAKNAHLKQLQFVFSIEKMPRMLLGDQFKIKQLLNNLLSNALKFTNYGTITLRANCKMLLNSEKAELIIEIQDTGIGISEVDKTKLFKPFHQLDDELNRSFQGTGLGLVICQELAFLMHGNIIVNSAPTVGSTFKIRLPLEVLNPDRTPDYIPFWKNRTACVYDPNPETRMSTVKLLRAVGVITYAFDKLQSLTDVGLVFNLAFITLQQKYLNKRLDTIHTSYGLNAEHIVFLYSGPAPDTHQISLRGPQEVALRLPLTTKKLADIYAAPSTVQDRNSGSTSRLADLPKLTILAVDDMEINLKLLKTWFKDSPVDLQIAESGSKAVNLCEQIEYDIILMDIQMPHMDGLQATQLVRKTELNQGTPIIAITAHAFQEEKQHFLASGMDDYLPKPIDIVKLVELLKEWCPSDNLGSLDNSAIDWSVAIQRSNGDRQVAFEYLDDFVKELPNSIRNLETLWQRQNIPELKSQVHRLHGASSYTGTVHLKKICNEVEILLKSNQLKDLTSPMSTLLIEAEAVISFWHEHRQHLLSQGH